MATVKELWSAASELLGHEELTRRFRVWITRLIRVARQKEANLTPDADFENQVTQILADLNSRTGARFRPTDGTKHLIRGRMAEGYTLLDFTRVHEVKAAKWKDDPAMRDYLRPSTLYRPSHFDEYLAEWFKADREREELAKKRAARAQANAAAITQTSAEAARKAAALAAELSRLPWHGFGTWGQFVRHCIQFPDKPSLDTYLAAAPQRLREMREAPRMTIMVLLNQVPAWAEQEYGELKKKHLESSDA